MNHPILLAPLLGAMVLLLAAPRAHAGRPMTVDDAAVVDPGQCQLETYTQRTASYAGVPAVSEYWLAPACNVDGNWELGLAAGRASGVPGGPAQYGRLQAKTVFKPLAANDWGVGLVLGDQYQAGQGLDGNWTLNLPFSVSLRDDRILFHLNAGWLREHVADRHRHSATWGSGAEFRLTPRCSLTAEVFGQQNAGSHYQFGASYALVPDRVQIDGTWGQHFSRSAGDKFISIGLVFQTPSK
ncbi:MAG: hypothetical protein ACEQSK_18500 [Sphingomonadaceae bacterium]